VIQGGVDSESVCHDLALEFDEGGDATASGPGDPRVDRQKETRMANYSRWDDIKKGRSVPTTEPESKSSTTSRSASSSMTCAPRRGSANDSSRNAWAPPSRSSRARRGRWGHEPSGHARPGSDRSQPPPGRVVPRHGSAEPEGCRSGGLSPSERADLCQRICQRNTDLSPPTRAYGTDERRVDMGLDLHLLPHGRTSSHRRIPHRSAVHQSHNPKVGRSNPPPATQFNEINMHSSLRGRLNFVD